MALLGKEKAEALVENAKEFLREIRAELGNPLSFTTLMRNLDVSAEILQFFRMERHSRPFPHVAMGVCPLQSPGTMESPGHFSISDVDAGKVHCIPLFRR